MLTTCNLILADDHPLVLAGMRDFFIDNKIFKVVDTATSSTELVASIKNHQPDIVVTDFSMPGDEQYGDGLSFISFLFRRYPDIRILVVTMVANPLIIQSLYKAGVSGVILKSDDMSQMHVALNDIRMGRTYLHPSLKNMHVASQTHNTVDPAASLSPKEIEVLRHFIDGNSLTEIANNLHRSIKTISNQKRSAMRKLNIESDQELISYCSINNLFR